MLRVLVRKCYQANRLVRLRVAASERPMENHPQKVARIVGLGRGNERAVRLGWLNEHLQLKTFTVDDADAWLRGF